MVLGRRRVGLCPDRSCCSWLCPERSAPIHSRPLARCAITGLAGGKPYSSTPAFSSHFISLKRKPAHTHFVDLVEPSPPAFIDRWERGSSELGVTTELH